MHSSSFDANKDLIESAQEMARMATSTTNSSEQATSKIINTIDSNFSDEFGLSFKEIVKKKYFLEEKQYPAQKQKTKHSVTKETKKQITSTMEDHDLQHFLAGGQSFKKHDRERLKVTHMSIKDSKTIQENRTQKENMGKIKVKPHHGRFESYNFDRKELLDDIRKIPEGSIVNWTEKARKFNLTINGKFPLNGGQVIAQFAKENGIEISKFNTNLQVHATNTKALRIRRIKKKITTRVSVPTPRTSEKLRKDMKQKLESGEIYIGEKVTPKISKTHTINKEGSLEEKRTTIYGRKIPLEIIFDHETKRQENLQVLRQHPDTYYENLPEHQAETLLQQLGETSYERNGNIKEKLKEVQRTRHVKIWHDHSDLLNRSYVSFMVSFLYDPAVFFTDDEYANLHPGRKTGSIQSMVERPCLYILGQSPSTDADQLSYINTRLKDLTNCKTTATSQGILLRNKIRVFSGDGPARQFEAGQQRGGNYTCICGIYAKDHNNLECCLRREPISLEDRRLLMTGGIMWRKFENGVINPFASLTKDELIDELEARNVDTYLLKKPELQEQLNNILHGIQRPPALMTDDLSKSASTLGIPDYEVLGCEPLHDITNIVQNIITELPYHIESKDVQKEFENFYINTISEKNQIKGSDARLYAIKLSKFTANKLMENKVEENIFNLVASLVEIIKICYSPYHARTKQSILRLYNQTFIFAVLCKIVIGTPKKMTSRKFYGAHFHSLTTHAPEVYRVFCLRSVIPEQEERGFGDLRRISENTSNRQADYVIDNAVMRFNAQQNDEHREDAFSIQESVISHQAKLLPPSKNTIIPNDWLKTKPSLVQSHLERISDFLVDKQWWTETKNGLEFHDTPSEISGRQKPISHHRSTTLKEEHHRVQDVWRAVVEKFRSGHIQLPLKRLKVFKKDGRMEFCYPPTGNIDINKQLCSKRNEFNS